jgi:hypothetical protein
MFNRYYRCLRSGRIVITNDGWFAIHLMALAVMIAIAIGFGFQIYHSLQVVHCLNDYIPKCDRILGS